MFQMCDSDYSLSHACDTAALKGCNPLYLFWLIFLDVTGGQSEKFEVTLKFLL